MFAALFSHLLPLATLIGVAQTFTPRFEVVSGVVVLDVSGLSRLFGSARDIGEHLQRAVAGDAVRVAVAPTMTTAIVMALGRPGLSIVAAGEEAAALVPLRLDTLQALDSVSAHSPAEGGPAQPALNTSGWSHPRHTHQASHARRVRAHARGAATPAHGAPPAPLVGSVFHRWGVHTLGALAALPAADLASRVGDRGLRWQRWARGADDRPLVPWVEDIPFEGVLELEWPIEGLEPLSFVLARVLEPLAERLEQADRGAVAMHTTLHLTSKTVHTRRIALPAPMRDPKTLRTLVLLDLESHPPDAPVDRVRVLLEPTPARIVQWTLYARAQPAPEQVSTLVARLTALMGEGHVGSPRVADSWKPGAFEMRPFQVPECQGAAVPRAAVPGAEDVTQGVKGLALRRYRLPIPVRVRVSEGRPIRITTDRHGITGGAIVQAAGPWRTSGQWWTDGQAWDGDEWDVAMMDGTVYRLSIERSVGQWFLEGTID